MDNNTNKKRKMTIEEALKQVMASETLVKAAGNDKYTKVTLSTMADLRENHPNWTDEEIVEWCQEFGVL